MYKSCLFKRFSTIFTALFFLYIAHERTAQNLILSVRLSLFTLFLIERHRSQNQGSLKREEQVSNFKEGCAQLWLFFKIYINENFIVKYYFSTFFLKNLCNQCYLEEFCDFYMWNWSAYLFVCTYNTCAFTPNHRANSLYHIELKKTGSKSFSRLG